MRSLAPALFLILLLPVPAAAVDLPARTPGAVLSAEGFALKCVTRHPVHVRALPSPESSVNKRLPAWTFLYVLPPDASTPAGRRRIADLPDGLSANGFYRVSTTPDESQQIGYVFAKETVLWGHRQAVVRTPAARAAHDHMMVFDSAAAALRASADGKAQQSKRVGREFKQEKGSHAFFPVVSQRTMMGGNGVRERVYELMFFGKRDADTRRRRAAHQVGPTPDQVREIMAKSRMEIAFVIDTTGSMRPGIDAVRQSVAAIARHLAQDTLLAGRVRVGLVGYRDHLSGNPKLDTGNYASRVFTDLTADFGQVDVELHRMEPERGGQDPAEDGLLGIETALDQLSWTPMAWKHVVLVTDASVKASGHRDGVTGTGARTMRSLVDARRKAANVHALAGAEGPVAALPWILSVVQLPGRAGDERVARAQFEQLAGIHPRAADRRTVGFHIQPKAQFSVPLIEILMGSFRNLARLLHGDAPAPVEPAPNNLVEIPWGYLELLQDGLEEDQIHRGFATQHDHRDRKIFEEVILIRRAELVSLRALLDILLGDVRIAPTLGQAPALETMLVGLRSVAAGTYSGEKIDAHTPLRIVANQIASVPLQTDALNLTPQDLVRMPAADRAEWIERIETCIARIVRTIEGSTWQSLTGDDDPENVYTFVPLEDLP